MHLDQRIRRHLDRCRCLGEAEATADRRVGAGNVTVGARCLLEDCFGGLPAGYMIGLAFLEDRKKDKRKPKPEEQSKKSSPLSEVSDDRPMRFKQAERRVLDVELWSTLLLGAVKSRGGVKISDHQQGLYLQPRRVPGDQNQWNQRDWSIGLSFLSKLRPYNLMSTL